MTSRCVVVIGHVDHGKTALVRALTGVETDRLPEEKARGLSITPGFAYHRYPSGVIDFVDAPGHADFVQSMVSGTSGAQAALVVISGVEGIGAQTFEHLNIAELLGISQAVIAVTKSDLLTPSKLADRMEDIRTRLTQTPFGAAPMVACSAATGDGIDSLQDALEGLLKSPMPSPFVLNSFLPIDRVFSLPGRGTIVTGTLLGCDLTMDTPLILQPSGRTVALRGLQSRGVEREQIQTGERMAANLRGVAAHDIARGAVLCAPDHGTPSACVDVHLRLLVPDIQGVKHMQEMRVLFGTCAEVAQLRLFRDEGDAETYAQLRFKKPVPCFAGQRAILRRLSPAETIGGATFLDPQASAAKSNDKARLNVLKAAHQGNVAGIVQALSGAGGGIARVSDIARLGQIPPTKVRKVLGASFASVDANLLSSAEDIEAAKAAVLNTLAAYHLRHPLHPTAPQIALDAAAFAHRLLQHAKDALLAGGQIRQSGERYALRNHDPMSMLTQEQRKAMRDIETIYRQADLTTPDIGTLPQTSDTADLRLLLTERGQLISLHNIALKQTLVLHRQSVETAARRLGAAFPAPQTFTTSEARTALKTSRRIIVPLLEYFDILGVTVRRQDTRQMAPANSVSPDAPAC